MYRFSIIFLVMALSACSTTPSHVGSVERTKDGSEYSIKDTEGGFLVSGHFSDYQFVRNSKAGFTGCMNVLNSAARDYAIKKGEEISYPKWDEIEIIDHGRDIISAVMHVNCQYQYRFSIPTNSLASELEKLKQLHESNAIIDKEYSAAKRKLLGL
jgi:hypothetical protein